MANKLKFDKKAFQKEVEANVKTLYRKTLKEANPQQLFQAVSYAIKDTIIDNWLESQKAYDEQQQRNWLAEFDAAYGGGDAGGGGSGGGGGDDKDKKTEEKEPFVNTLAAAINSRMPVDVDYYLNKGKKK